MRTWPSGLRTVFCGAAAGAAAALAAWMPAPRAEAVPLQMSRDEVMKVVARCVAYSKRARGKPKLAIAVVDNEGNSLGVFRMTGLTGEPNAAVAAALARAGTGAYFSSDQQTFTTRTAAFIIQDHFPPGVRFMPGGPLYGVEFSSFKNTDVNRVFYPPFPAARDVAEVETRVRGDLGGVALYKNGRRVGALGIDDGDPGKRVSIPQRVLPFRSDGCRDDYRLTFRNLERGRDLEQIALAAARGRLAPKDIRSDELLVGGIRLVYSRGTSLRPVDAPDVPDPADGSFDPDFPLTDGTQIPSRFADFTIPPPAGEPPEAQEFDGQVPLAVGNPPAPFAIRGSAVPGGPTRDEVLQILWQGAQRANITRAAIRRPIGVQMQCWICVVDTTGDLLGAFRFTTDTTLFSYDVAAQKARTAMFFSDAKAAFSCRAVGLFSQAFYPAGQQGAGRGPLFQLQDGLTVGLIGDAFLDAQGVLPAEIAKIRNGITIFPGGVPLYRDGVLIGGVGVSGDGVDQDDIVADFASRGFGPPGAIRCDRLNGAQIKAAFDRVLDRIDAALTAAGLPDPENCNLPVENRTRSFFYARFKDARRTLRQTELEVEPSYVKYPRHPSPVTIRPK